VDTDAIALKIKQEFAHGRGKIRIAGASARSMTMQ